MLDLLAFYISGALLFLNAVLALAILDDSFEPDFSELRLAVFAWPVALCMVVAELYRTVLHPAFIRAYSTAFAEIVGFYWTMRAKLPF